MPQTQKNACRAFQRLKGSNLAHVGRAALLFACLWTSPVSFTPIPASADSASLSPSSTLDLTLKDAIKRALEYNRPLIDRRSDREVQKFSLEVAEDRWTPQISLKPFASTDRQDRQAGVSAETGLNIITGGRFAFRWEETVSDNFDDSGSQTLSFSQPLLKGAGPNIETASFRQNQIQDQIYVLALRKAVEDLIVQVSGSYRALIAAGRQVEIGEESLRRAREQLKATRALILAGRVAQREAVRSETTVANRELALTQARNRLDIANFNLLGILELDSTIRIHPLDELKVEHRQEDRNPALEEVLRHRPDFLQAELQIDLAQIALEVAQDELLPDLSLGVTWNRNDRGDTDTRVRVDATFPLTDRVDDLSRLSAGNRLRQAKRSLAELRESIGIEVHRAINDVEIGLRLIELARGARELATENLVIEKKKFGQGLASSFEVSSAEDALVDAEQSEVDTIISYLEARTRLDQSSGRTLDLWGIRIEEESQ